MPLHCYLAPRVEETRRRQQPHEQHERPPGQHSLQESKDWFMDFAEMRRRLLDWSDVRSAWPCELTPATRLTEKKKAGRKAVL